MAAITYLETSEEITSVVDRLRKIPGAEAILVVPKGSVLLQSVVNLKLLLRQSKSLGKGIKLVTADRMGKNLAVQVGFEVFDSLDDLEANRPFERSEPAHSPVLSDIVRSPYKGEPTKVSRVPDAKSETVPPSPKPAKSEPPKIKGTPSPPRLGRIMGQLSLVADWAKSRKGALWIAGGALLLIIIALFMIILPTATIAVTPKADPLQMEQDVIVDTAAKEISTASPVIIPGKNAEQTVNGSDVFQATGQKNIGNKASGTITITNCEDSDSHSLPSGSKVTSGGLSFTTSAAVSIPGGTFAGGGATCTSSSASVAVAASDSGANYNVSGAAFGISSLSSNFRSTGSTAGGTSQIVTVVTSSDVNSAKDKLTSDLTDKALKQLSDTTNGSKYVTDAVSKSVVSATASPGVDQQSSSFTLTEKLTAKAVTFQEKDLEKALIALAKSKVGQGKDILIDPGKQADVTLSQNDAASGTMGIHASLAAFSAQHYDPSSVAKKVKGKTVKSAESYFKSQSAIAEVKISIWPSFKGRLPYFASHIKIKIETPKH
jgi:hypothetical protein